MRNIEPTVVNLKDAIIKAVIIKAVNLALVSVDSCCNTPGKFCSGDVWKGNLELFAVELLRNLDSRQEVV